MALVLRNALDTKHAHEGDAVYLEVSVPVYAGGRLAIPRGSYVNGVVTESKPAKGVKGKGQLFIRFETLTLPNGVTRDFRSRLGSADAGRGQVDPKEGVSPVNATAAAMPARSRSEREPAPGLARLRAQPPDILWEVWA